MRHPDPQEFQRLVDGELSRRRAHKLSAHMRSCPECAAVVERIRATGALLRLAVDDMIADAPLEGLSDRVLSAIEKGEGKKTLGWSERFGNLARRVRSLSSKGLGSSARSRRSRRRGGARRAHRRQ